jgi:bifunctional non-homologous end joining protein LigD
MAAPAIVLRSGDPLEIPPRCRNLTVKAGRRIVRLTSLSKPYFPEAGLTKGDLLRYYASVAPYLLPHLRGRAMVMKRYPNGIHGKFFFMKRTPSGAPEWLERCAIEHASGSVIDFPVINDLASLLWVVNLGCIDLNPWYSRCDDVNRPDFLHFDLDPVAPAPFSRVREVALLIRDALRKLGAKSYAKTTGSRGLHIYVPIVRGPLQKEVWTSAKAFSLRIAEGAPELATGVYKIANRPAGRVLVDYNQNAWGRTLASVYSVRPRAGAYVSTPVSWEEVEGGVEIEDFDLRNVPARLEERGDLWRKLLWTRGRFDLRPHLQRGKRRQ